MPIGTTTTDFSLEFKNAVEGTTSHGYSGRFATSTEEQIGGEQIDVGVDFGVFSVGYSFRLPALIWSSSREYTHGELSEWTTETTESTKLSCFMEPFAEKGNERRYHVKPYLYWSENNYLMFDYLTEPSDQNFWSATGDVYNKPDPAFNRIWADGSCNHKWDDAHFFSSDISINPPMATVGERVKITATIRNFSEVGNGNQPYAQSFKVSFYQGDPDDGGTLIGYRTIAAGELKPRSEQSTLQEEIEWTAQGSGEQRIYAVIDLDGSLTEVHDEKDPDQYNNNKGYGVLLMDRTEFIDVGQSAEKAYHNITMPLGESSSNNSLNVPLGESAPISTLHVPLGAFSENLRIDMRSAELDEQWSEYNSPFEIVAYQTNWEKPEPNFSFTPAAGAAPAVIMIDYAGTNLTSIDEEPLMLHHFTGGGWEPANHTCGLDSEKEPLYKVQRFPDNYLLAVPICKTGVYALSGDVPPPPRKLIYLPAVMKK